MPDDIIVFEENDPNSSTPPENGLHHGFLFGGQNWRL